MNKLIKYILILSFLFPLSFLSFGQMDVEFWFAAPGNDRGNSTLNRDRPIQLVITTYDKAAHVVISQPARDVILSTLDIPANSYQIVDLTGYISQIEVTPNTVSNNGILIQSNEIISAYYEQNSPANPDIYSLKGRNALGTKFIIPSQMSYDNPNNIGSTSVDCKNAFVMVAKEDNTIIEITPKKAIVGHAAGVTFSITLNRGETYSCRASSRQANGHLAGSVVEVTNQKPIAISVSDDSVLASAPDLAADQIISQDILGFEYVVVKGFLGNSTDIVCVTATQDNTVMDITYEGNTTQTTITNAGETATLSFGSKSYLHIKCQEPSKVISVFHLSGFDPQPAGAIIPPIRECAGSSFVIYSRSTSTQYPVDAFGIMIVVDENGKDHMTVKKDNTPITGVLNGTNFNPVSGTGNKWWYYRGENNNSNFPPNHVYTFENTQGSFLLGLLNGRAQSDGSCRMGYFSNFSTLNIGSDKSKCPDSAIWLDAGTGFLDYEWHHLENPATILGINDSLEITAPGTYWVNASTFHCNLSDTIVVTDYSVTPADIGGNQGICPGTSATFDAYNVNYIYYKWSNGEEGANVSSITTSLPGNYDVIITDNNGCKSSDDATVSLLPKPAANPIKHH